MTLQKLPNLHVQKSKQISLGNSRSSNENSEMREAKDRERRDLINASNMNYQYLKTKTRKIRLAHNQKLGTIKTQ